MTNLKNDKAKKGIKINDLRKIFLDVRLKICYNIDIKINTIFINALLNRHGFVREQ
tara:strand:- start:18 stop:185 length:168 start_codon:yes stop_codon:yes gene_type:complete